MAALMRFQIERGHVDDFAGLLSRHWELSKMIDAGSTNTLIDQIFDAVDDLLEGKMVCGAGGGGFLQVVLKKGVSKDALQRRLKDIFSDTDINVWDCTLV
jgi:fucokinase